jgi:non-reducing end alpha-L-arabinofuranosidase
LAPIPHSDGSIAFQDGNSGLRADMFGAGSDPGLPGGYSPMKKQGAIVLGSGGDCCKPGGGADLSAGTFYEGVMTSGDPSDATENAVQANITAAGYGSGGSGGGSYPSGHHRLVIGSNGLCVDVYGNSGVPGAVIDQWPCNGQSNQQFQFLPGPDGFGESQTTPDGTTPPPYCELPALRNR